MTYSDFTLPRVQAEFGLNLQTVPDLFAGIRPASIDPAFQARLNRYTRLALAINTEKARSEWLIAPLLAELWQRDESKVSIFSGVPLDVDEDAVLKFYDSILSRYEWDPWSERCWRRESDQTSYQLCVVHEPPNSFTVTIGDY